MYEVTHFLLKINLDGIRLIYIIVLNWKNADDTIECIKSLFAMEYKQFRVVICDNNSPDNSYNKIKKEILNIKEIGY